MYRSSVLALTLATSISAVACTTASESDGSGSPAPRRNVISREEIAASTATTAFDAVRELRPLWLRRRGPDLVSAGGRVGPRVAVDNVLRGGLDQMEAIRAETVEEIRFIRAADATTRFGTGVQGGVIEVIMRRGTRGQGG